MRLASAGESARGSDGTIKRRGPLNREFLVLMAKRHLVRLEILMEQQPLDHFVDAADDVRDPCSGALVSEGALLGTQAPALRFHLDD